MPLIRTASFTLALAAAFWFATVPAMAQQQPTPQDYPAAAAQELAQNLESSITQSVQETPPVETPAEAPAEAAATQGIPDTPASLQPRDLRTPITVEHQGTDNVGARLALQLKEIFSRSSLFRLTSKDEPKIKLVLQTKVEFDGRPNSSSIYAAVWVFSESETTLKYYLASETGIAESTTLEYLAEVLVARSDTESSKYAYLLE